MVTRTVLLTSLLSLAAVAPAQSQAIQGAVTAASNPGTGALVPLVMAVGLAIARRVR